MLNEQTDGPGDLRVLEIPIDVVNGAKILRSNREERELVPDSLGYRVGHGLDVKYPFMVVDNRIKSRGRKFRRILHEALRFLGKPESKNVLELGEMLAELNKSRHPEYSNVLNNKVSFLLRIGLEPNDILDFLVEPHDVHSRIKHKRAILEAQEELGRQSRKQAFISSSKTASIGPSYDINSWWHIGLQEELNKAQHEKPVVKQPVDPSSLKKKDKKEPVPYEKLLDKGRDKNLSSMKSTEQLLRESQI
jgi:hypothetical protein